MPPIVRRRPLFERAKAYLDPYDFLLWLSEQVNDDTYDDTLNQWATPLGIALNLLFIIARGAKRDTIVDDVFSEKSGRGWFTWLSAFVVHFLTIICCLNAFYTFFRKKHYRLFEQPVDVAPATPAARRVRVDDSPTTGSPIQYVRGAIARARTGRQAPDAENEVWEVSIWDAKPFNLTLFTMFSPGHIVVYYALLPVRSADVRPSLTVLLALGFGFVLSLQLGYLKTSFNQQTKDKILIQGEVMNEYNTKFVHPSLNKLMRDVATQTLQSAVSPEGTRTREVDVYTPTVVLNRGFSTNPNTNYAGHYSPQNQTVATGPRRYSATSTNTVTPASRHVNGYSQTTNAIRSGSTPSIYSSPIKADQDQSVSTSRGRGYLGVYDHAASPLRKSASNQLLRRDQDANSLDRQSHVSGIKLGKSRRRETDRFQ